MFQGREETRGLIADEVAVLRGTIVIEAAEVAAIADGVVVGSALVQKIEGAVNSGNKADLAGDIGSFCASLSAAMQRK